MGAFIDMRGRRYARLTPVAYMGRGRWRCRCSCGRMTEANGGDIRSGHTRSCGCLYSEVHSERMRKLARDPTILAKLSKARRGSRHNVEHVSDVRGRIYGSLTAKEWRAAVRERDDHTCQRCGARGKKSEVHHLVGLAKLLRSIIASLRKELGRRPTDNEIYDEALKRETLWHTSNGAVYCKDCHVDTPNYRRRIGQEKRSA